MQRLKTCSHIVEPSGLLFTSQIAILVCNSLALQACNRFDTARVNANELVTTRQACRAKLIANYSKNRARRQPRFRTPNIPFPKPVALTTQPARL
ncbi:hypothetical protein AVEN_236591-1 [Araneus ventricosus]|uniref:Uncharacterized protein n=1 Tax=Araneus ventricosus TaxID=182803 RepID=A0A4Y2J2H1_ARAVE|nr:hypothetical protein AVEN_149139-1 [Araneus ventricosus]GBM83938.1 hypothetical protein AVEN_236591-1 [Araneus ventricosus]